MEWDQLPAFDRHSKCVKCGHQIQEPVPAPEPKKKESAAVGANMVLPVEAPPPTCAYCNGMECPWSPEAPVPEHMHQFCDCCGYEWVSAPLG